MDTEVRRRIASIFMQIGGLSWIGFGLSHVLIPVVLGWESALAAVPAADAFGFPISNRGVVYLFNADLALFNMMLGLVSILFAPAIRNGKRMAAIFSMALGIVLLIRAGLQSYYVGGSLVDVLQWSASAVFVVIYLFPLTGLHDFSSE